MGVSSEGCVPARGFVHCIFRVCLALLVCTCAPPPSAAEPEEPGAAATGPSDNDARTQKWDERLAEARDRISRARLRAAKAEAAYARARHDGHPRGEALAEIEQEWNAAAEELQAARTALPELLEEARRAGVEPGVLRPYRD